MGFVNQAGILKHEVQPIDFVLDMTWTSSFFKGFKTFPKISLFSKSPWVKIKRRRVYIVRKETH